MARNVRSRGSTRSCSREEPAFQSLVSGVVARRCDWRPRRRGRARKRVPSTLVSATWSRRRAHGNDDQPFRQSHLDGNRRPKADARVRVEDEDERERRVAVGIGRDNRGRCSSSPTRSLRRGEGGGRGRGRSQHSRGAAAAGLSRAAALFRAAGEGVCWEPAGAHSSSTSLGSKDLFPFSILHARSPRPGRRRVVEASHVQPAARSYKIPS